jgi:hypothetical protein
LDVKQEISYLERKRGVGGREVRLGPNLERLQGISYLVREMERYVRLA